MKPKQHIIIHALEYRQQCYRKYMETLKQLIKAKKLDWVNPDITEGNFPIQPNDFKKKEYKLFDFGKSISLEDAIKEIEKEGFAPATLRDLLLWPDWNGENWVVALASFWRNSDCHRIVPVLGRHGSRRGLSLHWFVAGWGGICRFLAVRKSSPFEL